MYQEITKLCLALVLQSEPEAQKKDAESILNNNLDETSIAECMRNNGINNSSIVAEVESVLVPMSGPAGGVYQPERPKKGS